MTMAANALLRAHDRIAQALAAARALAARCPADPAAAFPVIDRLCGDIAWSHMVERLVLEDEAGAPAQAMLARRHAAARAVVDGWSDFVADWSRDRAARHPAAFWALLSGWMGTLADWLASSVRTFVKTAGEALGGPVVSTGPRARGNVGWPSSARLSPGMIRAVGERTIAMA